MNEWGKEGGMEWIEKDACVVVVVRDNCLSFFFGDVRVRVRMLPAPKSSLPFIFPLCDLATSRVNAAFINEVVTAEKEYVSSGGRDGRKYANRVYKEPRAELHEATDVI